MVHPKNDNNFLIYGIHKNRLKCWEFVAETRKYDQLKLDLPIDCTYSDDKCAELSHFTLSKSSIHSKKDSHFMFICKCNNTQSIYKMKNKKWTVIQREMKVNECNYPLSVITDIFQQNKIHIVTKKSYCCLEFNDQVLCHGKFENSKKFTIFGERFIRKFLFFFNFKGIDDPSKVVLMAGTIRNVIMKLFRIFFCFTLFFLCCPCFFSVLFS